MGSACIVDFVAFKGPARGPDNNNSPPSTNFIIKELCIVDVSTAATSWFLFQPPAYDSSLGKQRTNRWLTKNFHGLSWEEGHMPYSLLQEILTTHLDKYSIVYVKGLEKLHFLQPKLNSQVFDLAAFGCPALRSQENWNFVPRYSCLYHRDTPNFVCARDQAFKLYVWYTCKFLHSNEHI